MTTTATTVAEQAPALRALSVLTTAFPHLPAATFEAGSIVAPHGVALGLKITLHGSLADFEAWRQALAIDPATVTWADRTESHSCPAYQVLHSYATFADIPIELTGFAALRPLDDAIAP